MSLNLKIIQISDLDEILDYEKKKLIESIPNEMDRELSSWNAAWRREALEHYLPLGWSFLARDEFGKLMGYFIAQPLLFFESQTQSLWVEHIQFTSLEARDELCETAYKLAREKHFQKVFFPNQNSIENSVRGLKAQAWNPAVLAAKTTKA
jgi:hypothetical protein